MAGLSDYLGYGLANQQMGYAQQQAYTQATTGGLGSLYGSVISYGPTYPEPVKMKKTGKILTDLRKEIEDWHGDILR